MCCLRLYALQGTRQNMRHQVSTTMTDLSEIKAALAAATPGPWKFDREEFNAGWDVYGLRAPDGRWVFSAGSAFGRNIPKSADAALIANAPAWLAELVDRCEKAERYSEQFGSYIDQVNDLLRDRAGAAVGDSPVVALIGLIERAAAAERRVQELKAEVERLRAPTNIYGLIEQLGAENERLRAEIVRLGGET